MDDKHTKNLSDMQREVLEKRGTERPFSGALLNNQETGEYSCAACGSVLFHSDTKFKAPYPNEGWPSFYDVASEGAVELKQDTSQGMVRTEAVCKTCGGHLGHMFNDGDPENNQGAHYCINSASINFKGEDGQEIKGDGSSGD